MHCSRQAEAKAKAEAEAEAQAEVEAKAQAEAEAEAKAQAEAEAEAIRAAADKVWVGEGSQWRNEPKKQTLNSKICACDFNG